jgi:hypothetical protein
MPAMTDTPESPAPRDVQGFAVAQADNTTKLWTGLILALLLAGAGAAFFFAITFHGALSWSAGLAGVLLLLATGLATGLIWLYARPTCFEVSPEGLKLVWPARTRKLPRNAFADMQPLSRIDLGHCVRLFGVGGLFGSFGRYRSEYLGNMDLYVTRTDAMVLLRLKNRRPLILTPQDPNAFLAALRNVADQARHLPGEKREP